MQPKERLALATLLGVTILGHGVRLVASAPTAAPGGFRLISGPPPADVGLHRALSAKAGRPVLPGERIDLNAASVAELSRLPRVGVPLAKAIVAARTESGGFLGFGDLDRVDGIGPGLIRALDTLVTFGDTVRIRARRVVDPDRVPVVVQGGAQPAETARQPVVWQPRKRGQSAPSDPLPSGVKIHLNSASQNDLERLPGIGPTRARAIVAYRQTNGPFASVADLAKVPGFPRRLVTQLGPQVVVP